MKKWIQSLIQISALMTVGVVGVFVEDPATAAKVVFAISLFQAVLGIVAHNFNPDGTPAESAWQPGMAGVYKKVAETPSATLAPGTVAIGEGGEVASKPTPGEQLEGK